MNIFFIKKIAMGGGAVALLASSSIAFPVFAKEIGVNVGIDTSINSQSGNESVDASIHQPLLSSTTVGVSATLVAQINAAAKPIQNRIASLQNLIARLQKMKRLSASQQSALQAEIQTQITDLNNLLAGLSTATSSASLNALLKTDINSTRIYALVEPQINVLAAADRVNTLVIMLQTVATKLQNRLASTTSTTASSTASLQASLSDLNAKLTDAKTQSDIAVNSVISLKPDHGDKTIMQANTAALKDARTKIETAAKDLKAAQADANSIIRGLKIGGSVNASVNAHGSTE